MKLEIGCGGKARGNVNLDIRRTSVCNLIASAENLPLRDHAFSKIFCSQALEHLENSSLALKEINRVLSDDGVAKIDVPKASFTNGFKALLLRVFFNFPFSLRPKEILWLYSLLKGMKHREPAFFHKHVIKRWLIERYLTVVNEQTSDPILFIFLQYYVNKLLRKMGSKKQLAFARVDVSILFTCKKR